MEPGMPFPGSPQPHRGGWPPRSHENSSISQGMRMPDYGGLDLEDSNGYYIMTDTSRLTSPPLSQYHSEGGVLDTVDLPRPWGNAPPKPAPPMKTRRANTQDTLPHNANEFGLPYQSQPWQDYGHPSDRRHRHSTHPGDYDDRHYHDGRQYHPYDRQSYHDPILSPRDDLYPRDTSYQEDRHQDGSHQDVRYEYGSYQEDRYQDGSYRGDRAAQSEGDWRLHSQPSVSAPPYPLATTSENSVPSQAEATLTDNIFERYDPLELHILSQGTVAEAFGNTGLPAHALEDVWEIAGKDDNGFLTRKGVSIALRLIGHAQRGEPVSEALLSRPGLPPSVEGLSLPTHRERTGSSAGQDGSPVPVVPQVPKLRSGDKAEFMEKFRRCKPVDGMLSGEKAKEAFLKSKLPIGKLPLIWKLINAQGRGSLDATGFCLAMHIIQSILAQPSGAPGSFDLTLPGQAPGNSIQVGPRSIDPQWDVTPAEKAKYDSHFEEIDTTNHGYIEVDIAVPVMMQSNLPVEVIARIWCLSDLNEDGRLTRDGFAIASHLMRSTLDGKALPATLPSSLVPPSLRSGAQPTPPPQKFAQGTSLQMVQSPPSSGSVASQNELDAQNAGIIDGLQGKGVQDSIDAMDEALRSGDLEPSARRKCVRLLSKLCAANAVLPKSLQIEVSYDPASIPRYRGGFADVWKGESHHREVAVKALRVYAENDLLETTRMFCKEFVAWKALRHPNVLPLLGAVMSKTQFVMVSEWMVHGNIIQFVTANQVTNRFKLLADVARGLIYMHGEGMIHGDLKGANILIDGDRRVRLADFGLLTVLSDSTTCSSAHGGTSRWMAPELFDPEKLGLEHAHRSESSDCYALGMVVYEVLSGRLPLHQYASLVVPAKVVDGKRPARPGEIEGVWFTDDLWNVLQGCWTAQPADRLKTEDVLRCLEQVSGSWKPLPLVEAPPEPINSLSMGLSELVTNGK